jgi:hypothetical protein
VAADLELDDDSIVFTQTADNGVTTRTALTATLLQVRRAPCPPCVRLRCERD